MLNVILWLPLAVGLACFLLPRGLVGAVSVVGSLVTLGLTVGLIADFTTGSDAIQHAVSESWIPALGVRYELGVDGISLFLVLLTAIGWSAAHLYSAFQRPNSPRNYFFMLGLAQTATLGAFLAQDLLLFVLFFDLMLIPFYILIGVWGSGDRVAATLKMIIYTLVGSLLMLIAAIATAVLSADRLGELTFGMEALAAAPLSLGDQQWIFWFFAAAFLVKMPAFLVHGWMADAYRACPLPVLALLSGVLSKVAAYGFLRIVLPIFPDATVQYQEVLMLIAVASILYGSIMAFTQTSLRLIAGYSSIAQLGFITLGIFALRPDGADGSVIQMFNHGLVVIPLFFIIAVLHERFESDDLREMGGMARRAPILAVLFVIVTMATLAMPGSANFVGEFYILSGAFDAKVAIALVASIGIALAAFYALRLFQRTMHNRLPEGASSREITLPEAAVIVPLVGAIVAIALYPALILDRGEDSATRVVTQVASADCTGGEALAEGANGAAENCFENYGIGEEGGFEPARAEAPAEIPGAGCAGCPPRVDEAAKLAECAALDAPSAIELGDALSACGLAVAGADGGGRLPNEWERVPLRPDDFVAVNRDLRPILSRCDVALSPDGGAAIGSLCARKVAPRKQVAVGATESDCYVFVLRAPAGVGPGVACR